MEVNNSSNCVRSNGTQDHLEGQRVSRESEEEIRARTGGLVEHYFESSFQTISIEEEPPGIVSVRSSTPPPTYAQVMVGVNRNTPELRVIGIEAVIRDLEAYKQGLDILKRETFIFHQELMKNLTLKEENNLKMNACCLGLALIQICAMLYLYIWCRAIELQLE